MTRSARLLAALSLTAATVAVGCQQQPVAQAPVPVYEDQAYAFAQDLRRGTEALQAGDLAGARFELQQARDHVGQSPRRQVKADSFEALIDGAEALMAGDRVAAAAAWNRIADPDLRAEVEHHAARLGLELSDAQASAI